VKPRISLTKKKKKKKKKKGMDVWSVGGLCAINYQYINKPLESGRVFSMAIHGEDFILSFIFKI
jgi:hypothetical protein